MSFQYSDNYVKRDRTRETAPRRVSTTPVENVEPAAEEPKHNHAPHVVPAANQSTEYKKLAGVFGLVILCASAMSIILGFDWQEWMRWFMAGFFIIFGSFKLIGYENFIMAFPSYNILAKRFKLYNYFYPFIELLLGFLFAADLAPVFRNVTTLIIMLIGVYSITKALSKPQDVSCVCLGNIIKLPLSTVSLLEEGLMAAMAAIMLIAHFTL